MRVNAFSPGRTASEESYPTDPIAPLSLPSVVADITIGGTAARMYSLRAIMPVWNEFPTVFSYQWLRCHADGNFCQPIAGATTAGYVLTKADEGSTIRVSQTASNTTGSATTTSLPTAVVAAMLPVATVLPVVSGTGVVGTTLSTTRGTWSTSPDTTYGYRWRRCDAAGNNCAVIGDAVASTYKVAAADVDSTLRAVVTAVNEDGTVAAVSGLSAKVRPAAPAVSPPPVLSGTATVGHTATATTGTWTGISAIVKTTFWRCGSTCTAIVTSTARSYTLVAADAGLKIRASVTGVGPGGTTTTYAAAVLGPVKSAAAASALAAGAPVALKSSTGKVLATTSASVPKAGGQATVTVKPATGLKSGYRAWACPTAVSGADWQPCTKPVKLGDRAARLRVAVDAGEKIRVVVARRGR